MNTFGLNYSPKCPQCKKILNAASGDHDIAPEEGDFTVCAYCASPLIFKGKGLYFVTDNDFETMRPKTRQNLHVSIELVKKIKKEREDEST